MGKVYASIDNKIQRWIGKQHMFFVATAPMLDTGSINVSPKGHDTLRVLDERTLAFLDFGGSGVETIAHVRENGRIVIMMCAFEGPPKIYRFRGTGKVVTPLDDEFEALAQHFDRSQLGIRSIIHIAVTHISDSCGYGVPLYDFNSQRSTSVDFLRINSVEKVRKSLQEENRQSLDGLPGMSDREAEAFQLPK